MRNNNNQPNILHIKLISLLYKIASWMAITPNYNLENGKYDGEKGGLYSIIILLIIIGISSYSFYGRMTFTSNDSSEYATQAVLSVLSYMMLTISNLNACINLSLMNRAKFIKFLNNFLDIDKKLRAPQPKWINFKFYVELFAYYGLVILYSCYDEAYKQIIYNDGFRLYLFFRKPQTIYNITVALLIHNFSAHFQYRFERINHLLIGCRHNTISILNKQKVANSFDAQDIYNYYVQLVEMVKAFNDIFGWQILMLSTNFVLGILYAINVAIIEMNGTPINMISIHFWLNCIFYCFCILILCIPFAYSCNAAAEEARTTSLLSYTLIAQIGINDKELQTREQLTLLASVNNPTFSAAGFFDVDHTMLFTLFGSVTSYLIVLIQLKDMKL